MSRKKESKTEESIVISVRLPRLEVKKLDAAAKQLNLTRNKLVAIAISRML